MWVRLQALIIKELLAAFRDPKGRFALVVPTILQVFLYAYAATLEVSNASIGVLNEDWGQGAVQLISRLERASAFSEIRRMTDLAEVRQAIDAQQVIAVLHIDQEFSRRLASGQLASLQLLLDGRRSNGAQLVNAYLGAIVADFVQERVVTRTPARPVSVVVERSWFNPNREYRMAMIPALIGTLGMFTVMTVVAMSVARERELGTFEQLLVSPLQPLEIIVGKAIPGLIIGYVLGSVILLLSTFLFGIPLLGSYLMLYGALTVFLLAVIGVGLFISSLVVTQQQAILGAMVFAVPSMLLSGFATPIQNMPDWLRAVALANPLTHFLVILRGLFLRDMPAAQAMERIWPMALFAVVTLAAAAWLFRRRLE